MGNGNAASLTALVLGLATVLAGCIGGGGNAAGDDDLETTKDDNLGTIEGLVLTDEGFPVGGATVALGSDRTMNSLSNGTYRFANVEPGTYVLAVQKLGYESKAFNVEVAAGQTLTKDLVVQAIRVVESYHETVPFTGVLECALSASAAVISWVSPCDYPYTAVYYTAHDNGVNLSNYGAPPEPLENEWRWNTPAPQNTSGVWSELVWESTTDASDELMYVVSCADFDPVLDDCDGWSKGGDDFAGQSPIRFDWEIPEGETVFMNRVYLPWFRDPVMVAFDQKFDSYHTFFYGADPPDEFTVLPE